MPVHFPPVDTIKIQLGINKNGPVMKKLINSAYRRMGKYVPGGSKSNLNRVVIFTDHSIIYNSPYAHYQYIGKLYVMDNGKGAYYNPEYGFWSDKGKSKNQTNRDLKHPSGGGPYWVNRMMSAEKEQLIKEIEDYVRRTL